MHKLFKNQNDYQRIVTIEKAVEKFAFADTEKENILNEMQELFQVDGKYPILERNAFRALKHIFKL